MKRILIKAETLLLITLVSACSFNPSPQATEPSPRPSVLAGESRPASVPSLPPQTDTFEQASDKAISAANIAQSAQSQDDWKLVVTYWQQAITLMKTVPSSKQLLAKKKVVEYQHNLAYAQQKVKSSPSKVPSPISSIPPDVTVPEIPRSIVPTKPETPVAFPPGGIPLPPRPTQ